VNPPPPEILKWGCPGVPQQERIEFLENVLTPGNLCRLVRMLAVLLPLGLLTLTLNPWVLGHAMLLGWCIANVTLALAFMALIGWNRNASTRLRATHSTVVLGFALCLGSINGFSLLLSPLIGENSFYTIGVILPAVLLHLPMRTALSLLMANHLLFTTLQLHNGSSAGAALMNGLEGVVLAALASCCRFNQRWENFQQGRLMVRANATLSAANQQLDVKKREMDEVMAIAAHDLRSPLLNLHSLFTILKINPKWTENPYADVVKECLATCDGQLSLITHLLDAHKIETNMIEKSFRTELKIQDIAERSIEKIRRVAEERKIEIVNQLSEGEIASEPQALERILDNLLSNAVKFSPPGTLITLRQRHSSKEWIIEVADEGHGIPAHDVSQLFRKFYRGSNFENGSSGTGLGLFIVRQLAEKLGGSVHYRPGDPSGSIFSLRLPV
jgi:signal transduction histidine kinase